jgi:hypothetical protein
MLAGAAGFALAITAAAGSLWLLHDRPSTEDSPVNGTFETGVRSVSCMWAQAGC